MPEIIFSCTQITRIYLEQNYIREIDSSISLLKKLKVLIIYDNMIKMIPNELAELTLEVFDISDNDIDILPDSLFDIVSLYYLNLSNNYIIYISPNISNLISLKNLNLSNNKIIELPDIFSSMPNLECLDISYNKLTHICDSITTLHNLKELYISDNNIVDLTKNIINYIRALDIDISSSTYNISNNIYYGKYIVLNEDIYLECPNLELGYFTHIYGIKAGYTSVIHQILMDY